MEEEEEEEGAIPLALGYIPLEATLLPPLAEEEG